MPKIQTVMDKNMVAETVDRINRILEDFFFKPLLSTALERCGVENAREIRFFLQDALAYGDDKVFMEDGTAELVYFCSQVRSEVLPNIEDALLISPFHSKKVSMSEDEFLYRKMMCHIFADNLLLLEEHVSKLNMIYPHGIRRHPVAPEKGIPFIGIPVRA